MKNRKLLFSSLFTIFFCIVAFALMAFFSLVKKPIAVGEPASKVSYTEGFTEKNILFSFPFDSVMFSLTQNRIRVYFLENPQNSEILTDFGYEISGTVKCDSAALTRLIDNLGGIELESSGERLSFSGVQVTEILEKGADKHTRKEITEKIFGKIGGQKFSLSELNFLLNNTETDISFPEGYDILKILPEAAKNLEFINTED